jgi:glycine/D-amino acid oxidase-like deaminating enzyme
MFLLERAQSKGVKFVRGRAESTSIAHGRVTGVCVAYEDGTVSSLACDNLVIAAGPWTGELSKRLLPTSIPVVGYAGHSIVVRPSAKVSADGVFMSLHSGELSCFPEIFPRPSGEIYIAGVNINIPLPSTPEGAIPQKPEIEKLKAIADAVLMDYTVEIEQLCFRPMTEDGIPFICPVPEIGGVYVGAGHSYFGIMLGPGTGKILSEMVLGEKLSVDVSQFALYRHK